MRKVLFLILFVILIVDFRVAAQSNRLQNLANRLSQQADELSDRAYNYFRNRSRNNRSDVESLMSAQQLSGAANAFRRMVQDRRSDAELRDAISYLVEFSRRNSNSGSNSFYWRDSIRTIDDLAREANASGNSNGGDSSTANENVIGRVRWRGTVDDEVQLVIRGGNIETRTISGTPYNNGSFNFTSPLPNRRVSVSVNKTKGRGQVRVVQQPSRENDYTAVVQVRDEGGGAREYDLDISWSR